MTTQPQITYISSMSPAASGYITRDNMPFGFPTGLLELFKAGGMPANPNLAIYDFVQDGMQPGATVKRRQIAESTYVDDAFQVQSSKARIPATFNFIVTGYNASNLGANIDTLYEAVDLQPTWTIVVKLSTLVRAWTCWDAEVTVGFPVEHWLGIWAPVSVATLRSPQAAAAATGVF